MNAQDDAAKENAVYKHAYVRCYQLYTFPRNSLIPNTRRVYLPILKIQKPWGKKIKHPGPFAKEFHVTSSFWALKTPSDGHHNLSVPLVLLLAPIPLKSIWTSHFNLGPVSHPPVCQWEALGSFLSGAPPCAGTGGPLLGSPEATPAPALTKPQAQSLLPVQLLQPLTNSMMHIWAPYSSQLLIYSKIPANDPVQPGQQ